MSLDFHRELLYKEYKNICRDCISNGVLVPLLLERSNVPKKYSLSDKQWEKLYGKLSREELFNLKYLKNERRRVLYEITRGESEFEFIDDFYEWEMFEFVNRFPKYCFVFNPK